MLTGWDLQQWRTQAPSARNAAARAYAANLPVRLVLAHADVFTVNERIAEIYLQGLQDGLEIATDTHHEGAKAK